MTAVYVSPLGSDTASGRSPAAPMTVTALNAKWADGSIGPGDPVLLDTDHGEHIGKLVPPTTGSASPDDPWITIATYGGRRAKRATVSSYKNLQAAGWTLHATNVWKIDLTNPANSTGLADYDATTSTIAADGTDIGFLKVDGTIYGARKFSTNDLAAQWDFYCDGTFLYVRSSGNPSGLATTILASCDGAGLVLRTGVKAMHLRLIGSGGHAVSYLGQRMRVYGCELAEFGGSVLGNTTTRYGNGVELAIGCKDFDGRFNVIHDGYDVAFTMQGDKNGGNIGWEDISWRNNLHYRMSQNYEFWATGTPNGLGTDGFKRITIEGNRSLAPGGWGPQYRNTGGPFVAVHLLGYQWELPVEDFVIDSEDFSGKYPNDNSAFMAMSSAVSLSGITWGPRNRFHLPAGTKMRNSINSPSPAVSNTTETVEQFAAWSAATGIKGIANVLPASAPADVEQHLDQIGALVDSLQNRLEAAEIGHGSSRADLETQIEKLNGRVGRQVRTLVSGITTQFVPLAKIRVRGQNDKTGATFYYAEGGDSSNRTGSGVIQMVIYPSSAGNLQVACTINELTPFARTTDGTSLRIGDFTTRVTATDDQYAFEVTLYIQLRDTYQRVYLTKLLENVDKGNVELINEGALLSSLPGSVSAVAPTNVFRRYTLGTMTGAKTHDWASVNAGASATTTVTVTGAAVGDRAEASMDVVRPTDVELTAQVTATDTVTVTLRNNSASPVDLASGTLFAYVAKQPSV